MACTIIRTPEVGAESWVDFIVQQGKTDKGFLSLSLTNYSSSAASLIGTGSVFECAGSIYQCTETAIDLAAGTASADVAVYFVAIPSAGGTACTFYMDSTVPTWVDGKQGYYASAGSLSRVLGGAYLITPTSFQDKWLYKGQALNDNISRVRVTKNNAQSIPSVTATVVEYDDVVFDNLGEFTNGRFTAKEAGYYFVSAALSSEYDSFLLKKKWSIRIYKNGIHYSTGYETYSEATDSRLRNSILSDIVYLAIAEYFDIRCYHDLAGNVLTEADATYNYVAVHRLS